MEPSPSRRTCATWLRQAGVEPHLIALVLVHVDSRMVEKVYGRMPTDSLAEALRRSTSTKGGKVIQLLKKSA